jgi:hypothetical protein
MGDFHLPKWNNSKKPKEANDKHIWDNPTKLWVFDVKCTVIGTVSLLIGFRVHGSEVTAKAT